MFCIFLQKGFVTDRNTHTQTQRQAVGIELSLTIVDSLAYICDGFWG